MIKNYGLNIAIGVAIVFLSLFAWLGGDNLSSNESTQKISLKEETVFEPGPLLQIIESILTDLRSGKIDQAYDLTAGDFRKSTPLEAFKIMIKNNGVLSQNKYFQYHSFFFENNIVTFQGILVSQNGEALQSEFDLIKEDDKWKIYGIQLFKQAMDTIRTDSNSNSNQN